jgi:DNA-binding GntR family transcriptional regulator
MLEDEIAMSTKSSDHHETETLSARSYRRLRRLIIECRLAPGSVVSEPDISASLGETRAGVRAALLRLAQEKLVKPIPRRGYIVSPLTLRDARHVFELRLLLEPPSAALAVGHLTERSFATLDAQFETGYRPGEAQSLADFISANRAFRLLVAGASGNDRLAAMVATLVDESERYIWLSLTQQDRNRNVHAGYHALRSAILEGRAEDARRISAEQVETTQRNVIEALTRQAEGLALPAPA